MIIIIIKTTTTTIIMIIIIIIITIIAAMVKYSKAGVEYSRAKMLTASQVKLQARAAFVPVAAHTEMK